MSTERGREVIVSLNETFAVGDHDFTRFSIIPSVVFHLDIPDSFEGSWYTGKVLVCLKDAVFKHRRHIGMQQNYTTLCLLGWALKAFVF